MVPEAALAAVVEMVFVTVSSLEEEDWVAEVSVGNGTLEVMYMVVVLVVVASEDSREYSVEEGKAELVDSGHTRLVEIGEREVDVKALGQPHVKLSVLAEISSEGTV